MNHRFDHAVTPAFTELRLIGPAGPINVDDWAIEAPAELLPGVDLTSKLRAADSAVEDGPVLFIDHAAIAALTAHEAALIGLPPMADAIAAVRTHGLFNRPEFTAELVWKRPTGQPIAGAERCGAWLRIGNDWRRLPDVLFEVAEQIERLKTIGPDDFADRMAALAALREVLPPLRRLGRRTRPGWSAT
jgi:hypothetical protein